MFPADQIYSLFRLQNSWLVQLIRLFSPLLQTCSSTCHFYRKSLNTKCFFLSPCPLQKMTTLWRNFSQASGHITAWTQLYLKSVRSILLSLDSALLNLLGLICTFDTMHLSAKSVSRVVPSTGLHFYVETRDLFSSSAPLLLVEYLKGRNCSILFMLSILQLGSRRSYIDCMTCSDTSRHLVIITTTTTKVRHRRGFIWPYELLHAQGRDLCVIFCPALKFLQI